uniref:Uncharacterized protein n=1 Tax=Spongospora subterranea TaxID=70186 RepID=A0A0H5RD95_9EUKA|eukprot:CRZ11567.1 hypothetical protein [Spongospora subterranea]
MYPPTKTWFFLANLAGVVISVIGFAFSVTTTIEAEFSPAAVYGSLVAFLLVVSLLVFGFIALKNESSPWLGSYILLLLHLSIAITVFAVLLFASAGDSEHIQSTWADIGFEKQRSLAESTLEKQYSDDVLIARTEIDHDTTAIVSAIKWDLRILAIIDVINVMVLLLAQAAAYRFRVDIVMETRAREADIFEQVRISPPNSRQGDAFI